MVTTKLMYLLSDERDLPYGGYMMPDAAYFIAGREIRIPVPGGYKVFVEKQPDFPANAAAPSAPTPPSQPSMQDIIARLDKIEGEFAKMNPQPEGTKEAQLKNENSKRASLRDAF